MRAGRYSGSWWLGRIRTGGIPGFDIFMPISVGVSTSKLPAPIYGFLTHASVSAFHAAASESNLGHVPDRQQ